MLGAGDTTFTTTLKDRKEIYGKGSHDLEEHLDFSWAHIAVNLARHFDVSVPVIEKRLDKDGVKEKLRRS